MNLPRNVHPETLDHLTESDPRAVRSRADLRRINRIMGTRAIMTRAMRDMVAAPRRIVELGAGDGTLMLGIARALARRWPGVHLTLLDRQDLVTRQTLDAFHALGWQPERCVADVADWLAQPAGDRHDLILANLFIHHFEDRQLASMLGAIAQRTDAFFICEPRRAWLPLAGSRLVGLIGANAVTREDAVLSVHAGFTGKEISALWPRQEPAWRLAEYPAGLFSHCFFAVRGSAS
jgi:hypothetical protein